MLTRLLTCLLLWCAPAGADPSTRYCTSGTWGVKQCIRQAHVSFDTCQLIGAVARTHGLDPGFLARLIWQESRFDFNALSPAGARGIAQFMPGTAKLRGLADSYDPAMALEHAAQYLSELVAKFGNPGLAAVAYNGGEARASAFVAGTGGLATETRNYVRIITGLSAEEWRDDPPKARDLSLEPGKPFGPACRALAKSQRITPFKEPVARISPWGVQMAAAGTRAKAKRRFEMRSRGCQSAVRGQKLELIRKVPPIYGRTPFYVARLGVGSRASADRLCQKIRRLNCACAVYRN